MLNREKLKEFNSVVLASLLHDIGKFMQRAELELSVQTKNLEGQFCKKHGSYKHTLWTNQFIQENNYIRVHKDQIDLPLTADIAASHHRNDITPIQAIIQQADWYSAGYDRSDDDVDELPKKRDRYKTNPLFSIFQNIKIVTGQSDKSYGYNLSPLDPNNDSIFPEKVTDTYLSPAQYKALWDDFVIELDKNISSDLSFNHYLNLLDSLLKKYTWCIPANTRETGPDVSLYDHLKTSAAIASCVYRYHEENNSLDDIKAVQNKNIKKFILLSADVSGIQNFIFKLNKEQSKGVSKILRARSFYLSIATRAICLSLLESLGLPSLCLLQDAGGRFLLLLPNTGSTREKIRSAKIDIEQWFLKKFKGDLTFNIVEPQELCGNDFKQNNFSSVLEEINKKINYAKLNKLSTVLKTENQQWNTELFTNIKWPEKSKEGSCATCANEPANSSCGFHEQDSEIHVCEFCYELHKIGEKLTKKSFLIYSKEKKSNSEDIVILDNSFLKTSLILSDKSIKISDNVFLVEQLDYNKDTHLFPINPIARTVPVDEHNNALSFEQIANSAVNRDNGIGSAFLGILKADVDNLGYIFANGLGKRVSLSRYVTLSRMINFFFSSYVPHLSNTDKYKNKIYTVFAGGDDLTLIGAWESIAEFSKKLHDYFKHFVANNPDVSFSSGITTCHNKFPVRRSIELAEECLEKSKKEKQRITHFDTTVTWEQFSNLLNTSDQLEKFYFRGSQDNKDSISTAFLYRLLKYHEMAKKCLDGNISADMRELLYKSKVHYDIARSFNKKSDEPAREAILKILEDDECMRNLKIPLFTVLYKNRKTQLKED